MVCFDILLAYTLSENYKSNIVQEERIQHITKYYNADVSKKQFENGLVYQHVYVCDEDAFGLLRDIPNPVYCVHIQILRSEILLYSFWKVTKKACVPPRGPLLFKKIYWSASQLERRRVEDLL